MNNKLFFIVLCFCIYSAVLLHGNTENKEVIPVIIVHKNNSYYLEDVLWQAKQYNERVILIGDTTNNYYSHLKVEHYLISNYNEASSYFASIYRHLSRVASYDFELTCFQRWFILKEFMQKNNIPVAFYCDSDVMLYENITKDYKNFQGCDMSVIVQGYYRGGMSGYWKLSAIEKFCAFLTHFYKDTETITRLVKEFETGTNGIWHHVPWYHDDNPFLSDFCNHNKNGLTIGQLDVFIDDTTFDSVINWETTYDQQKGFLHYDMKAVDIQKNGTLSIIKNIQWIDHHPYCFNITLKKLIRFKSLHFESFHKQLIKNYKREFSK